MDTLFTKQTTAILVICKKYAHGGNNMAWIIDEKEAQRIAKEIEEANKKWNQEKEQENKDKD
jgi:hypothetical protein